VDVHTNDASFASEIDLMRDESDEKIDWTIILDDTLAGLFTQQTFRADAVVTIVLKTGAITLLDCESREAFTFAPRSISASQVVSELLAVVTEECLAFPINRLC
jgi:hypothetical protein